MPLRTTKEGRPSRWGRNCQTSICQGQETWIPQVQGSIAFPARMKVPHTPCREQESLRLPLMTHLVQARTRHLKIQREVQPSRWQPSYQASDLSAGNLRAA